MRDYLNTPKQIEHGFLNVDKRINQIQESIGKEKISTLSKQLADLLYHIQPDGDSLNKEVNSNKTQSHISIAITNASIELQSAYHFLTIGNIPSVFRQSRLANEFIAVAIFLAVPNKRLINILSSKKHTMIAKLEEYEESSFWDLYEFKIKKMGKVIQRDNPVIKGNMVLKPFMDFLKIGLKIEQSEVQTLRKQIYDVQHPSSHGTLDIFTYHFMDVEKGNPVGINYSENKIPEYRNAMNYLIWHSHFLNKVLNKTCQFLKSENEN